MDYPESFDHMLAAWNERDPERVRGHLEKALSPEVHFIDPSIETRGLDEFEANVHAGSPRPEGAPARRGQELLLPGFDVTEVDASGRVRRVLGFFGPIPT